MSAHDALAHDLAMWLSTPNGYRVWGWLTWENIEFPGHKCRPDVFAMYATLSPQKWNPVTYEVKTSRADFLADVRAGKWESYRPFSAYVVFAVPDGLVHKSEIPKGAGLIVQNGPGVWVRIARGHRNPDWRLDEKLWMNLCLKGRNPSPFEIARQRTKEPSP